MGKGGIYNFVTKEEHVEEKILKFHGHKLKQVQPLPGSIQVVFYKAIIHQVNFIQ